MKSITYISRFVIMFLCLVDTERTQIHSFTSHFSGFIRFHFGLFESLDISSTSVTSVQWSRDTLDQWKCRIQGCFSGVWNNVSYRDYVIYRSVQQMHTQENCSKTIESKDITQRARNVFFFSSRISLLAKKGQNISPKSNSVWAKVM